jgi:transcriptional regulator GlxA family with amidase domain
VTIPVDPDAIESEPLRSALRFIHAHADDNIGAKDIAGAACLTVRAIQYIFRKELDTTPTAYLRRFRLERVRNELLTGDPQQLTVKAVASQFCSYHPARFPARYRRAFGEAPSDTLTRRRITPPDA